MPKTLKEAIEIVAEQATEKFNQHRTDIDANKDFTETNRNLVSNNLFPRVNENKANIDKVYVKDANSKTILNSDRDNDEAKNDPFVLFSQLPTSDSQNSVIRFDEGRDFNTFNELHSLISPDAPKMYFIVFETANLAFLGTMGKPSNKIITSYGLWSDITNDNFKYAGSVPISNIYNINFPSDISSDINKLKNLQQYNGWDSINKEWTEKSSVLDGNGELVSNVGLDERLADLSGGGSTWKKFDPTSQIDLKKSYRFVVDDYAETDISVIGVGDKYILNCDFEIYNNAGITLRAKTKDGADFTFSSKTNYINVNYDIGGPDGLVDYDKNIDNNNYIEVLE